MATQQCWGCRKRRLVCDLARPECRKCQARGIRCPGYGSAKPLVWIPPGQVLSRTSKLVDQDERAPLILEVLTYFNANIVPDLISSGHGGPDNPYYIPPSYSDHITEPIVYVLASSALGHRILRTPDGDDRKTLTLRLQRYRGVSLRALAGQLDRISPESADDVLLAVISLLLTEIQLSISPGWVQHVHAAAILLQIRGGMANLVAGNPSFTLNLPYYMIIDVMGGSTSPPADPARAARQLDYIGLLPIAYGNGLLTTIPCPPGLFAAVARINHLRSLLREDLNACDAHHYRPFTQSILDSVAGFAPQVWARDVVAADQPQKSQALSEAVWYQVASAYQAAVAIYCIESLSPTWIGSPADGELSAIRCEFRALLISQLQSIACAGGTQARKLLAWPLVIAGFVAGPTDHNSRLLVTRQLRWISTALGTCAPLVALKVLTSFWRTGLPKSETGQVEATWDRVFDKPYAFII